MQRPGGGKRRDQRAGPASVLRAQADSARGSSLEVDKEDQSSRRQLAVEIGQFLRRALNGEHRGSSGRDRLKLANRCYLILADFRGRRLQKPICSDSFSGRPEPLQNWRRRGRQHFLWICNQVGSEGSLLGSRRCFAGIPEKCLIYQRRSLRLFVVQGLGEVNYHYRASKFFFCRGRR